MRAGEKPHRVKASQKAKSIYISATNETMKIPAFSFFRIETQRGIHIKRVSGRTRAAGHEIY